MSWQLGAFDDKQHQEHLEEAFKEVESLPAKNGEEKYQ